MIFRTSGEVSSQRGEAGMIYRIAPDNSLTLLGKADLTLSSEQLASQFGVSIEPSSK